MQSNMSSTIFYSWQSDREVNRNFIADCLERAIKKLNREKTLIVDVAPDRALLGSAGALRIDKDIERRIDACTVFLGDVTLVTGTGEGDRPSPNPNVLLETGRAANAHGWDRLILVFNTVFGEMRDLPFDLDKHRVAAFKLSDGADVDTRRNARDRLANILQEGIGAILGIATVRLRISEILDALNPEILREVRLKKRIVQVMLSPQGIARLEGALSLRGAGDHLQLKYIGSRSVWPHQSMANHVMELGSYPGEKFGYELTFTDTDW